MPQPPHTAIAVGERIDELDIVMEHAGGDERVFLTGTNAALTCVWVVRLLPQARTVTPQKVRLKAMILILATLFRTRQGP